MVTKKEIEYVYPPSAYYLPCEKPFAEPVVTRDQAVQRDPVWLAAFIKCANKSDKVRQWVEKKQAERHIKPDV